jgi:3-oxoacyl-[acyl-carrier protein] reductase
LVQRGATVVLVSRDEGTGQAAAARLQERDGGRVSWHGGDTTRFADMQTVVSSVLSDHGRVDLLVGSGSPRHPGPKLFLETDPEDYAGYFVRQAATRLNILRACADTMISQGKGKVVFLTTDAGRVPTPSEALLGAGAAGLMFATRALARELGRYGIRINAVSTTLTRETPAFERFADAKNADLVITRAFKKIEDRSAFGLNSPEDVAAAVLYFLSDASDQVSGATLSVNGGLSFPG